MAWRHPPILAQCARDQTHPPHRDCASAVGGRFTGEATDLVKVLRRIELQFVSFLNHVYNPF
jgi:hypothetical protein